MPKIRRVHSFSSERSRRFPYAFISDHDQTCKTENPIGTTEDVKEWEEARCPICMEYPHNAVLLKCSSHDKGCRPYMCNTSYRHSNCLDQFCKSHASMSSATELLQEIPLTSITSDRQIEEQLPQTMYCGTQSHSKLVCPLCRGEIYGYVLVEPARQYMNSKVRSCSSETCEFSGTYSDLRKHARSEHPFVRPSEVDPKRQRDWMLLEHERNFEDILSLIEPNYSEDRSGDLFSTAMDFWTSFFDPETYDPILNLLLVYLLGTSRNVGSTHNTDAIPTAGSSNNLSAETMPRAQNLRWRNQRSLHSMPQARPQQLRGHSQRERVIENIPRAHQTYLRSQHNFRRNRRTNEVFSQFVQPNLRDGGILESIPRASRLRWRNQRWYPWSQMPQPQLRNANVSESDPRASRLRWRSQR